MEAMTDKALFCFHCGEPVPSACTLTVAVEGETKPVCCAGCQAVVNLILQSGQSRYYQFRSEPALKPAAEDAAIGEDWQRFDQRESLWGNALKDGRYELLLQVEGIRCAACAWLIRSQLEARKGIDQVQVDVATGFVRITWRPTEISLSKMAAILTGVGYRPHLPLAGAEAMGRQEERRNAMKRLGVAGLGMMQVMMYAVGLYAGEALGISEGSERFLQWVSLIVTTPVLIYSGSIFYTSAWRSLRNRRVGMDVPVALAISIAFIMSCINFLAGSGHVYFDSVVMFIFFLSLGRYAELVIRHRNLQTGLALARLLPEWADLIKDGEAARVPAADLRKSDLVRVRAGQTFPADGRIVKGQTEANEALLTGESRPVAKQVGDRVIAGSINQSQTVEVEVVASGQQTTISSMGRLLLRAQSTRPSTHSMPAWLVPAFIVAVLFIASGTWLAWQVLDPSRAFSAMLAVLVASLPCALSLALPVVHAAASRRLLDEGVLLTRGDALHALNEVDTVVFDKTGTLTQGTPEIATIELNPVRSDTEEAHALHVAAALEGASAHPIARAFRAAATDLATDAPFPRLDGPVAVKPGRGLQATVEGTDWRIGTAEFVGGELHKRRRWNLAGRLAGLGSPIPLARRVASRRHRNSQRIAQCRSRCSNHIG